ncbi:YibE/F family protein [Actinomarinicola tropica]|uniref:YibE/F family protein n=1 Tax=Actinomarinicola tropica TaxID=2789776 RepID=A0A5Q2RL94_9ACTN|nr:YibE/F family protein [Actinomarinicola tropica]QGG96613.1 YibE/F family protein [Actinomarinicola tropica]
MSSSPLDHAHSHTLADAADLATPAVRRTLVVVLAAVAALTVAGLLVLWPDDDVAVETDTGFAVELVDATVTRIELVPCSGVGEAETVRCERITSRVTSGPTSGTDASFELFPTASNPTIERGDGIVLSYAPDAPAEVAYQFADFQRGSSLMWLAGLFALAVVALARMKGVRALLGVAVSLVVIVGFLLPALLTGRSPLLLALVASSTIAFLALFLAHGVNERTAVALLGTLASLAVTGVLALVFVEATSLTGLGSEEATLLRASSGVIDFQGLLLAGILIGALGVLDDVTVTQVSAVWELKQADPSFGPLDLYRRAVRIGRDHIASVVNTLALAYAGAALPLLLLFTQASRSFGEVITGEAVAVEVVRTLVGSIGLVAAVPLTTGLAALVIGRADAPAVDDRGGRAARREARRARRRDPFWSDVDV